MNSENPLIISKPEARRIAIKQAGLHRKNPFGSGKNGLRAAFDQLGYIQIDTISVVNRAHHHTLWNRVSNYQTKSLHHLQAKEKRVLEYWSHAAAYLPMEDYSYTLRRKQFFKDKKDRWPKPEPKIMKDVFERVKAEGPLMARDFEHRKKPGEGWWDWKPAKWALERLFLEGDLVVSERKGFQKVYDLPERYLPSDLNVFFPDIKEYARYLIRRYLRLYGLAKAPEISYLRKAMNQTVKNELEQMMKTGEVLPIMIHKNPSSSYYTIPEYVENIPKRILKKVRILSPFDNILIQRKRTFEIFDFDYQIECYVPKEKRKYGYFSLPLLYGDKFIGRMDSKADRKKKEFIVFNLVLEEGLKINDHLINELATSIKEFIVFNQCETIRILQTIPTKIKEELLKVDGLMS